MLAVFNGELITNTGESGKTATSSYRINRLTLPIRSTDRDRIIRDINGDEDLGTAIEKIRPSYKAKVNTANEFIELLNGLDEKSGLSP